MKNPNRLFRLSVLAAAVLAASPSYSEQLTISSDTQYTAPILKQAVVINSSGKLTGTVNETDMVIEGGRQDGYPRVLDNSGTISDAASLTVDGGVLNRGTITNIGTVTFVNTYNRHDSGEGNLAGALDNRGTINADTLLTTGGIGNTNGTIDVRQFGNDDYRASLTLDGGTFNVAEDAYVQVIRVASTDQETSFNVGGNLDIGEAFRLQDDVTATVGSFTGSGYVGAEDGTIDVKDSVEIGQYLSARNNGNITVAGHVKASGIQTEVGGTITVGSATVDRIYTSGDGSSISVTGQASADTVSVNTGSSLHVGSIVGKTGDAVSSFNNKGTVTIDTPELKATKFENSGSINADNTGVSHLDKLTVIEGAWITGKLSVEDFNIAGSLTVNENSNLAVDKLGTNNQAVQAVTVKDGSLINASGDAYFNSGLGGGGELIVGGKANMVAGYQEIRLNLKAESLSALGMTALYDSLDVANDLTLENSSTLIVESTDLKIGKDFVLNDGAKVQVRSAADGLEVNRVVLNTNEESYFQAYRNLKVKEIQVTGSVGRIETWADGGNSSLDIGKVVVNENSAVVFENGGTYDGHTSTASVDTVTLGNGASLINAPGSHGGEATPAFEGLQIGSVGGTNATIANANLDGSMSIGTLTGSNNTIEVQTIDQGVTVNNNQSTGLVYQSLGDDADKYGTQGALQKIADMIQSSEQGFTAKVADGLVDGAGQAEFNAAGEMTSMSKSESLTMSALKQFNNATLAQWRYETNHLSERLGEVRNNLGEAGAWARIYGADSKITDNVTTEVQTNTIQVGGDVTVGGNWIVGGAFSYTSMDGDISNGAADGETYTLAAYASGFFDCGGYVDVIGRVGRMSTDIDAFTSSGSRFDGSYNNTALGLSIETGYHWNINQTFFVEPQAELSYGYVFGDDFSTSSRVQVEQDNFQSLVGRLGARFGATFPDNAGTFYFQASVNHEFLGDNDFDAGLEGQTKQHFSSELDGTWVSYGLGVQFSATDALSVYGSLSRADGDDYQDDYRYSVGLRYVF